MKEDQIRPKKIFEKYLELSKKDISHFFSEPKNLVKVYCPACTSTNISEKFFKNKFQLNLCSNCNTLYVSPRPKKKDLDKFYKDSESTTFWAREFFPSVAETRRKLIFKQRAKDVYEYCQLKNIIHKDVIDVGAGYGLFLEEWRSISHDDNLYALEPGQELASVCREKQFITLEKFSDEAAEWANKADLITSFEVFEHVFSPYDFLESLIKMLKPGGLAVVSGLTVDGFDIQYLWEESKSISPPHHLNFLSINGLIDIFDRVGFENIEVHTPGKLDFDIVKNSIFLNKLSKEKHRFINAIVERGQKAEESFQSFLRKNRMSSHFWVFAQKKEN
jgi:2-polyprenyl-3-methyl-5-hydroxy-6-metoxy-1,4-benzoquinol methylase